jgi:ribosomal protein S18 acetylase RimI-like enzyme
MFQIDAGQPDDGASAAKLIAETARKLFLYVSGDNLSVLPDQWFEYAEREWRDEHGIYSHRMSHVARHNGSIVGLLISRKPDPKEESDSSEGSSRSDMQERRWTPMETKVKLARLLFPEIPDDVYYVSHIATHPSVRKKGLGRELMELAFEQGRAKKCKSCHLDVESTSPAVNFYERLGLRVLVKTWVPDIPDVSAHYRMVRDL